MGQAEFRQALLELDPALPYYQVKKIQNLANKHLMGVGEGWGGNNTLPSENRPSQTHAGLVSDEELRRRRQEMKRRGIS